jgi:hypothetical protein
VGPDIAVAAANRSALFAESNIRAMNATLLGVLHNCQREDGSVVPAAPPSSTHKDSARPKAPTLCTKETTPKLQHTKPPPCRSLPLNSPPRNLLDASQRGRESPRPPSTSAGSRTSSGVFRPFCSPLQKQGERIASPQSHKHGLNGKVATGGHLKRGVLSRAAVGLVESLTTHRKKTTHQATTKRRCEFISSPTPHSPPLLQP